MATIQGFSLEEYDRMIERGDFETVNSLGQKPRVELIFGEILPMSPIGPPHEDAVDLLCQWSFAVRDATAARIRIQNSLGVRELESAPEPDIAWVKDRSYAKARPTVDDVLLVIEVSDSSLSYDRSKKAKLHGQAGVADYWIVNLREQTIEVRRDPKDGQYQALTTHKGDATVTPLRFPGIDLPLSLSFGK